MHPYSILLLLGFFTLLYLDCTYELAFDSPHLFMFAYLAALANLLLQIDSSNFPSTMLLGLCHGLFTLSLHSLSTQIKALYSPKFSHSCLLSIGGLLLLLAREPPPLPPVLPPLVICSGGSCTTLASSTLTSLFSALSLPLEIMGPVF